MKTLLFICTFILLAGYAHAYDGITFYGTEISNKDRVSSKGVRLTTVRQILRQDRANYHKFNKRDPRDQDGVYFKTAKNRQLFDTATIKISPQLKRAITGSGNVDVTVFVLSTNLIEVDAGFPPAGVD